MNTAYIYTMGLALMSCCLAYLIILVRECKVKLSTQNVQLIQLYLDKKFIDKLLNAVVDVNKGAENVIERMLSDIKEYFHLDDIVIYNPTKIVHEPVPGIYLRTVIAEHIKDNKKEIFEALSSNSIIFEKIENDRIRCAVYIIALPVADKQEVIAFVHNPDAPLERHEIDTLAKSIRGVLTAALNLQNRLANFS